MDDTLAGLTYGLLRALRQSKDPLKDEMGELHDACIEALGENNYCVDCGAFGHEYAEDSHHVPCQEA